MARPTQRQIRDDVEDDGPPAPEDLVGLTVGSFLLRSILGAGGAGTIYLGEHPIIGTKVAVKILRPEIAALPGMAARFIDEARATSQLASPHLPRYYDFGTLDSGQPYAILELLEGENLAQRIGDRGPLSISTTIEIATQVASALELVHAAGIIHRDVKPENLFLARCGELHTSCVKLIDFGIAKRLGLETARTTGTGIFLGSPCYCAPEQALGQPVAHAADVYGLGATIFTMLLGRPPFEGDVLKILSDKTLIDAPDVRSERPEVPAAVAELVAELLRRPAGGRPTMSATRARLEALGRERRVVSTLVGQGAPSTTQVAAAAYDSVEIMTSLPAVTATRAGWGRLSVTLVGIALATSVLATALGEPGTPRGDGLPVLAAGLESAANPDAARPTPADAAARRAPDAQPAPSLPDAPPAPPPRVRRPRPRPLPSRAASRPLPRPPGWGQVDPPAAAYSDVLIVDPYGAEP